MIEDWGLMIEDWRAARMCLIDMDKLRWTIDGSSLDDLPERAILKPVGIEE